MTKADYELLMLEAINLADQRAHTGEMVGEVLHADGTVTTVLPELWFGLSCVILGYGLAFDRALQKSEPIKVVANGDPVAL